MRSVFNKSEYRRLKHRPVKIIQLLMDDIKCCTERITKGYSTTPCYLCCDNIPCFIVDYARVINEMIGKRLSFPNRNKMWKMYYALHMNGCENIATREILEI